MYYLLLLKSVIDVASCRDTQITNEDAENRTHPSGTITIKAHTTHSQKAKMFEKSKKKIN